MKPDKRIENTIKNMREITSSELDKRTLTNMLQTLEDCAPNLSGKGRLSLWRYMMNTKIAKLTAAAALVVVFIVGIHFFNSTSNGRGVVLAEVNKKVESIHTITHSEKWILTRHGEEKPFMESQVYKYGSADYGILVEQYQPDGQVMMKVYFLKEDKKATIILPIAKKYLQFPLVESWLNRIDQLTPKGIVSWFLDEPYTRLGRKIVEGVEAEGFEVRNPQLITDIMTAWNYLSPLEECIARVWIDVETSLPVAAEGEVRIGPGLLNEFKPLEMKIYSYGVNWGAEINPEIFQYVIPQDYTPIQIPPPQQKDQSS